MYLNQKFITLFIISSEDRKNNESTSTSYALAVLLFAGHVYKLNNRIQRRKSGLYYSPGNSTKNSKIIFIILVFFSWIIFARKMSIHMVNWRKWRWYIRTMHLLNTITTIWWPSIVNLSLTADTITAILYYGNISDEIYYYILFQCKYITSARTRRGNRFEQIN